MTHRRSLPATTRWSVPKPAARVGWLLAAVVLAASLASAPAAAQPTRHAGHGDATPALHSLRAPATDEHFYFVMADRFENGDPGNDRGGLADEPLVSG